MPLIVFLLFASLSLAAADPQPLPSAEIQDRFSRIHSANAEREQELRKLFAEAGCSSNSYSEEAIPSSKLPNVICFLPGSSKRTIVVSAHFDNRGPGEGAIDNWSGASLLPSLFESLRTIPHSLTFQFIGFTDEEKGLIGSRDYVNRLSREQRANILLDVNLDCLGLSGPIRVWAGRSNESLLTWAALVADRTKSGIRADTLDKKYDSDASAFTAWNIPAIDFHSLSGDTLSLLHSKRDMRAALDPASYYEQYKFLLAYLTYLDETLGK